MRTLTRIAITAATAVAVLPANRLHVAAAPICDPPADGRPVADGSTSTVTTVNADATGPLCYRNGLVVVLMPDAGKVTVSNVWVGGAGVRLQGVPAGTTVVLNDVMVRPTLHAAVRKGRSTAQQAAAIGVYYDASMPVLGGTVELNDVSVKVVASEMSAPPAGAGYVVTPEFAALRLVDAGRSTAVTVRGGSFEVHDDGVQVATQQRNVRGFHVDVTAGGTFTMLPSAKDTAGAGRRIRLDVVAAATPATSVVYGFLMSGSPSEVRNVDATVRCGAATTCTAYGAWSDAKTFAVTDARLTIAPQAALSTAVGVSHKDGADSVSILRSNITCDAAQAECLPVHANDVVDTFIADSLLSARIAGALPAHCVRLSGASWRRLRMQRSRVVASSSTMSAYGIVVTGGQTAASAVEIVDSIFPFFSGSPRKCPVIYHGVPDSASAVVPTWDLPVAATAVRCVLRYSTAATVADFESTVQVDADGIALATPLVKRGATPCVHGYAVPQSAMSSGPTAAGVTTVVSLAAHLPAFDASQRLAGLCVAPPPLVTPAAAVDKFGSGALVLRDIPAGSTVVGPASLASLTVVGSVPTGSVLSVTASAVGPATGLPAGPAIRVTGSVDGELSVVGGTAVVGSIAVTGGLAGRVVVDGASVTHSGPGAVTVAAELRGSVAVGLTSAADVVFQLENKTGGSVLHSASAPVKSECPVTLGPFATLKFLAAPFSVATGDAEAFCPVRGGGGYGVDGGDRGGSSGDGPKSGSGQKHNPKESEEVTAKPVESAAMGPMLWAVVTVGIAQTLFAL